MSNFKFLGTKVSKLIFSSFLSCVEVTRCVKFQIPRYKGVKVDIFKISPIQKRFQDAVGLIKMESVLLTMHWVTL